VTARPLTSSASTGQLGGCREPHPAFPRAPTRPARAPAGLGQLGGEARTRRPAAEVRRRKLKVKGATEFLKDARLGRTASRPTAGSANAIARAIDGHLAAGSMPLTQVETALKRVLLGGKNYIIYN
jgi:hypothetical protein